jgi:Na+/H+-dicarboxylate symporter
MKAPRLSLDVQILIGLLAGIALGLFLGDCCAVLEPAADAFIKIMQITVLPSVVVYIIAGIGSLKPSHAREVIVKGAQVLLLFWSVGIFFYFAMQFAFPVLHISSFFSTSEISAAEEVSLLDLFIPSNPFHSLAEGFLPGVVLFCLLLGFALIDKNNRDNRQIQQVLSILTALEAAISSVTSYLMKIIPLGIFAVTANVAGTITLERFLELQVYFVSVVALFLLLTFLVLPSMISWFSLFRYRDILAASSKALILAFSTGNTFITIPLIADGVRRLFGEDGSKIRVKSISQALVPIVFTFPSIGAFPPLLFILFTGWYYQNSLDAQGQATLILAGIPALFGSSYFSVPFLLNLLHLPSDAFELYISSHAIDIHFNSALSSMSIFSFTAICVSLLSGSHDLRMKKIFSSFLVTAAAFAVIIMGLNYGFANLLANAYQGGGIVDNMELSPGRMEMAELAEGGPPKSPIEVKVYLNASDLPPAAAGEQTEKDLLKRIQERGALRAGYDINTIPFAFFNGRGSLIGYGVEMAYDLARFINVSRLEFIPIEDIVEPLNSGACDIIISSVMITPKRLEKLDFTTSYMASQLVFVVKDYRKKEFMNLENVQKMPQLKVAILNGSALDGVASQLIPNAEIVNVNSFEEFFSGEVADAYFTTIEHGTFLTLLYPFYKAAAFDPSGAYKLLYAYPVPKGNEAFIEMLNHWLEVEERCGELSQKYDYWILGKNAEKEEPRWCIMRNVLHWVPPPNGA